MPEIQDNIPVATLRQQEMSHKGLTISWAHFKEILGLNTRTSKILLAAALAVILFFATISFVLIAPSKFAPGSRITIKEGVSLGEVSLLLQNENLISSRTLFEFCAMSLGGDKKIMAGEYLFKDPIGSCAVAARIVNGVSGIPAVRVTIPEGLSNKEVVGLLAKSLPQFDPATFLKLVESQEGYIFPDTYFISEHATVEDIVGLMRANFEKKIKPLSTDIEKSGHSLKEIIIMASILEKEVAADDDRALVSGILWRRIAQKMPLQVDAPFVYLLGKKSSELTQGDLQMKSPYNTYRNRGLPVGPIGNPGLSAIRAALFPKASAFLYYLADSNGITHYARTFDEHKANKEKYL